MELIRLFVALGPLAMYLLMIGGINLSWRPFLVSGGRDAAALGIALSGLVFVGPVELFFPEAAAMRFGPRVWLLLLMLYVMVLVLIVLLLRPRLVVYNTSADKLRSVVAELVERLDSDARWAGDSLVLPGLGVQLYLDNFSAIHSASLVSAGGNQSHDGWRRLQKALGEALARERTRRGARGLGLLVAAATIVAFLVLEIAQDPQAADNSILEIVQYLRQMVGR